ncbi:metal ABC transporter solute-binding protein, Zn/Mn family [Geobacter sp. SVR]|uniref:metal ABC transporter solute-binding protein, Zn/Mn family n=1 Tax=Geobacter sp. SVR TaxID=2495594 RepID=UPI00143F00CD|nr:zinc ABC transporter substrate-binding protein [Geobacter sp. SVR]BCS53746.1 periplasmic divalent manganese/zinc-binding lipoprotein [Geobacter sp. SVR]GCF85745.1 periplasmic divalent manganese/zinc-binding lipoprotein [Geobacter sp. SVR]
MKKTSAKRESSRMYPVAGLLLCVALLLIVASGCSRRESAEPAGAPGRLRVVTTLFPLYDFARTIAGDKAEVKLLLPPGVEPHSFEPRPDDVVRIAKSGLFIYTNPYMEPWAATVLKSVDQQKLRVVDAGANVSYLKASGEAEAEHERDGHAHVGSLDPHVWLDFENARKMVDTILAGFEVADPANAVYYRQNATGLKERLADLDKRYLAGLANCATRTFLHGGHFTFGYLAHRYGLRYSALSGLSSESEPSGARMSAMVQQIRKAGVHYLFAEELLSPRMSETLAAEAGVQVLKLHGVHNLGREEFQRGATFIGLMDENLVNLQKGLGCRVQ